MQYELSHADNRIRFMLRKIALVLLPFLMISACSAGRSLARENPMLVLLKNAVYGSACGLLLGGVLTLVVDSDDRGDVVRWGIVVGTFSGFGYGIYELSSGGGGYEEFTGRVRPDIPDPLACVSGRPDATVSGYSVENVAVPLSAGRALGRFAVRPECPEDGQMESGPEVS